MNAKDRQVLDKIAQHIESAIRYDLPSLLNELKNPRF